MGATYSGSSAGGPDGASQHSMASRHSSILGGPQEADVAGYRSHASASAHYGGQYGVVYGSAAISSTQQVCGMGFFCFLLQLFMVISALPYFIKGNLSIRLKLLLKI